MNVLLFEKRTLAHEVWAQLYIMSGAFFMLTPLKISISSTNNHLTKLWHSI